MNQNKRFVSEQVAFTERAKIANAKYASNMIKEITNLRDIGNIGHEFANEQLAKYQSILLQCGRSR
jgi:hypothetical protein